VIRFEREAYVVTVLGAGDSPDLDADLARRLDTEACPAGR